MLVTHYWRLVNAAGQEIDKKDNDDPLTVATALEGRYPGLRALIIALMSPKPAISVAHPSGEQWEFRFRLLYQEWGAGVVVKQADLLILPRIGHHQIRPLDIANLWPLTAPLLEFCIKMHLPAPRRDHVAAGLPAHAS